MENKNKLFLKEVTLAGYKSIIDVTIQLQKGLNVIIGKNAAGKTNFLTFLDKTLSLKYNDLPNFSSNLLFQNAKEISIKAKKNLEIEDIFKPSSLFPKVHTTLTISKKIIKNKKGQEESDIHEILSENSVIFDSTFLCHGIPKEYLIVDQPFSFKVEDKVKGSADLFKVVRDNSAPYFVRNIMINILYTVFNNYDKLKEFSDIENIKKSFTDAFKNIEELKFVLNKYSPIEDLKFSDNYNLFLSEDRQSYSLNNLFLEFKVEGNWLPYSNLSDGTKRLFYIISEVYDNYNDLTPELINFLSRKSEISRIILIEEPELGLHPHQFHKLMEFIKEECEKKQIIITTHSPQALDAIDENELNRIIIAYATNYKEGTKLRHLSDLELAKAHAYIKDDFLSDYWLYSDLEK